MLSRNSNIIYLLLGILLSPLFGTSQDSLLNRHVDTISQTSKSRNSFFAETGSSLRQKISQTVSRDTTDLKRNSLLKKPVIGKPGLTLPKLSLNRPIQINGGTVSYYYDYRSNIDTPFVDRNVAQHNITGQMSITVFNALPLNVSFFVRRTNSSLFADISDIRIDFNTVQYAQMVRQAYIDKLTQQIPDMRELTSQLKQLQMAELSAIRKGASQPGFQQKLVEYNEIINVPGMAESIAGPGKADSVRNQAREFINTYRSLKTKENQYQHQIDSMQQLITDNLSKTKRIQNALRGNMNTPGSSQEVMAILKEQGVKVPGVLNYLLALRRLSLGRSQLNYSELTARNVSLNGINIEYNSWYYLALAAGTVNYRFRDFILTRSNRKPQYMYLIRAGVGRLERNYVILSWYGGRKQSYIQNNSNSGRSTALNINGVSLESKYHISKNLYVITEVARSATPGQILYQGQKSSSFFNWRDKSDKAYAVKLFSFFPRTRTRLEGMYRYSGAAFQSFDRFLGNSARESWYIKAEQTFWKRQLRFTASLRKNEFSNPFIPVSYSSGVTSKTIQLTFRKKNWPTFSAGIMPFSQLTVVGNNVYENRFHALNAVLFHQYKVGIIRTSTSAVFNRFYNKAVDSGFVYFNAVNFNLQQYLFFKHFTLSIGGSHSSNTGFDLSVLEESIQLNLIKGFSFSSGLKITNYNQAGTKIGTWLRVSLQFLKTGWIQLHYENGLLPGMNGALVRNQLGNVMVTKSF
jgi:hypothetical protein